MEMNRTAPISANERIVWLDITRGFALLGILIINIIGFAWPMLYAEMLKLKMADTTFEALVENMIQWIVQGKFYTLFSLLFGIGFVIFIDRALAKGANANRLFTRRLLMLLGLGLIHGLFLWWGDILLTYAICGFLLILFVRVAAKTLLIWAGSLFFVFILINASFALLGFVIDTYSESFVYDLRQTVIDAGYTNFNQSFTHYADGTLIDIMIQRIVDWSQMISNLFVAPFMILPIFLLGMYAYRSGMLQRMQSDSSYLIRVTLISFVIGSLFTVIKEFAASMMVAGWVDLFAVISSSAAIFADLGLAVFYASVLLYLSRFRLVAGLKWTGRMALTNYLMQSLICCILFYNVGFGLYGKLGPLALLLVSIGIFIFQVIFSYLWLRKFAYGPLEWLWRKWTYA
jgi:uncharacterized protein